ncbi:ABC transporter permease, partial [Bacteroidota bacterium]
KLIGAFTFLALMIASLGLFGLAAFMTQRRTKEIGVRKVLGASIPSVVMLLSREFIIWVIIANLVAWPISHYAMTKWLQSFAYRIDINIWVFITAGIIALIIAIGTVTYQSIKAAIANPTNSLRAE